MFARVDPDAVAALLKAIVAEEILPAFGHLEPSDIEHKPSVDDPDDVVSRVDRAVEARLGPELLALLPDAVVIGEEAVHADARVLDALDTDGAAWVIDPIDGTRSFVRGEPAFGSMLALVVRRHTQAAWIALPVGGEVFVAEAGAGAWLNGERLRIPPQPPTATPRGTIYTKFMSEAARGAIEARSDQQFQRAPEVGSAAVEYTDVVLGRKEFVVYQRLLPWDHLPGALLVREATGSVCLITGEDYRPAHRSGPLLAAANEALAARIRNWFSLDEKS